MKRYLVLLLSLCYFIVLGTGCKKKVGNDIHPIIDGDGSIEYYVLDYYIATSFQQISYLDNTETIFRCFMDANHIQRKENEKHLPQYLMLATEYGDYYKEYFRTPGPLPSVLINIEGFKILEKTGQELKDVSALFTIRYTNLKKVLDSVKKSGVYKSYYNDVFKISKKVNELTRYDLKWLSQRFQLSANLDMKTHNYFLEIIYRDRGPMQYPLK
ncbi:MAG: hypothetical protein ACTTKZ_04260 [Bacteroides sp.]